jgi:hypothetical protein
MMKLCCLLGMTLFALATGACNRRSNDVPNDVTTVNQPADIPENGAALQPSESPADDVQQNREVLPSTASPIALVGLLGLLSAGGAVVVRILGRR